jgi:hypothetical protein
MEFFDQKIFTLDKTAKTLLTLFVKEAREALGSIPSDYGDRDPLDFSDAPFGSLQLLSCYLTEFLLTLKRRASDDAAAIRKSENSRELTESSIVKLVVAYLSENLYTALTLSDICAKFYIGKSQLCKLFAEHLGDGPMEHYHKLKTAEAKRHGGKIPFFRQIEPAGVRAPVDDPLCHPGQYFPPVGDHASKSDETTHI